MGDRYVGSLEDAANPTQMGLMSAAQAASLYYNVFGLVQVVSDTRTGTVALGSGAADTLYRWNGQADSIFTLPTFTKDVRIGFVNRSGYPLTIRRASDSSAPLLGPSPLTLQLGDFCILNYSVAANAWTYVVGTPELTQRYVTTADFSNYAFEHQDHAYKGDWSAGPYSVNSLVRVGSVIYRANVNIFSGPFNSPASDSKWEVFIPAAKVPPRVRRFVNQVVGVPNAFANEVAIPFGGLTTDPAGLWSAADTGFKIPAGEGGMYHIIANINFSPTDTNGNFKNTNGRRLRMLLNGTSFFTKVMGASPVQNTVSTVDGGDYYEFAAGDVIKICAAHNDGGTINLAQTTTSVSFVKQP